MVFLEQKERKAMKEPRGYREREEFLETVEQRACVETQEFLDLTTA